MEPDDDLDDLAEAWAAFKAALKEAIIWRFLALVYRIAGWRRG